MFQNKTNTPKLGSLVTREVKNAMLKTPGIQVVNDAQGADIVVRGRIIRYRVLTTAFDQRATTNEDVGACGHDSSRGLGEEKASLA